MTTDMDKMRDVYNKRAARQEKLIGAMVCSCALAIVSPILLQFLPISLVTGGVLSAFALGGVIGWRATTPLTGSQPSPAKTEVSS